MATQDRLHYYHPDWITPDNRIIETDLCVYGGTSAGVAAAVTGIRLGLRVQLLQPGLHLGGMTSGGLGWTDFGRKHVIGGLARQFYRDVGKHYGVEEEWRFEPHVAEAVFEKWVTDSQLEVRRAQFLEQVRMAGDRIEQIQLQGGLVVRARMFIDATYEGDLLAQAGASHRIGREANREYGETLNGIQVRDLHQFDHPIDPWNLPGDPESGLLPGIEEEDLSQHQGEGDHRLQAYNFRICMTDDPDLKIDWTRPEGFDDRLYELARRWLAGPQDPARDPLRGVHPAVGVHVPRKFDVLPHPTPAGYYKTDTNNYGAVSSDFIGANWGWPVAGYEERERIFQSHVRYQQGLYWVLANDPAIPTTYRDAFGHWGLARDEFADTNYWPHQLYVREARRLVGDYVITEADCMGTSRPEDPVGMASYQLDSHNCTRFLKIEDGHARVLNEGDVQVPPTDPYPISYRAIIPRRGECANLFVPVCMSASHISYGSARMEPVFMVLGESAAIAADSCLRLQCAAQDLPYDELRPRLLEANQVLALPDSAT